MNYFATHQHAFDSLFITHRYNRGDELLAFYNREYHCEKCKVMTNPITIDTTKKELFVLRPEDILEAANKYPNLSFRQENQIVLPNGKTELYIGVFEPINASF
jgi:hypothetical protein